MAAIERKNCIEEAARETFKGLTALNGSVNPAEGLALDPCKCARMWIFSNGSIDGDW